MMEQAIDQGEQVTRRHARRAAEMLKKQEECSYVGQSGELEPRRFQPTLSSRGLNADGWVPGATLLENS